MFYSIENEYLTAQIDDMGAQLHSLVTKDDGYEYLWQGNPDIWYGQAPVLFPVIGQLFEDKFRYNGKEYPLAKHGFARKMLFEAADVDGANKWQKIWNITLPSLIPIITINTILKIGGIFNADFGLFYNVTREGAAGQLYETTDVISTYTFRTFKEGTGISYGLSSAVSLMQSVVGIIMVLLTNAASKKIDPSLGLF